MKLKPRLLRFLLAPALLALAACGSMPRKDGALAGPFYTPANVRAADRLPEGVLRIALLPCASADTRLAETTLRELDQALATALARAARAEITPVARESLPRLGGRPGLLSTSVLPADLLARVAAETGAGAILFVDVTAYSPYPPLVIGLRARLLEIGGGSTEALWHFDNVFTLADPAVVNSARAHVLRRAAASTGPGDLSLTILQNPLMFADYAAEATWATLPAR